MRKANFDRISIADALAQIGVELTRLPKGGGVKSVLSKIAELALRCLGADVITLYQYSQEKDDFSVEGTGPTVAGEIRHPGTMRRKVYPGDVPWTVVKERKSGFYPDVEREMFLKQNVERPGERRRPRFIEREGIKSMAALLLPFRAAEIKSEEVVGVMFASYRARHEFNIDEITALATFADYASVAVLNARVEEQHYTEQMRMVEAMAANFAHRMGNLAGVCRIASQTLEERVDKKDLVARRQLDVIHQRANVLLELAERLTRPFKETGHMFDLTPLDIGKLLEEELKSCRASVTVIFEPNNSVPMVMSVGFQLRQVLHDLVNNALEALCTHPKPVLTLQVQLNRSSNKVQVEITDNGPGIPDAIKERLFNPGVTTKKEKLGIGLWWSRTFMQATGGNVILKHTEVGGGTTFLVELPLADMCETALPVEKRHVLKDILLVDDDPTWLQAFEDNLAVDNFDVERAASYTEAAAVLANTRFKVVVLDIRLVDADVNNTGGLELLVQIDKSELNTKVIVISAFASRHHETDRTTESQSFRVFS